jgi:hypothetical protein
MNLRFVGILSDTDSSMRKHAAKALDALGLETLNSFKDWKRWLNLTWEHRYQASTARVNQLQYGTQTSSIRT